MKLEGCCRAIGCFTFPGFLLSSVPGLSWLSIDGDGDCTGLLRQSALEELTNLTRTESPRRRDRNESNHVSTSGGRRRGGRRAAQGRSAAVRE
ncbi:Histone superfamily protein [Dorcoceras hygrometricum]|uniref:Histone superfamily protein n=1 Tax=Dorcoceras hygrometricum TaxID=472368 RepID=A0A2Z7BPC6_9LAMI|nr:Histone superfamily protein [Dorcoceras hygrometricum]